MSVGAVEEVPAEGGVTFELPPEPAKPAPPNYDNDANLVAQLSAEQQKALCKIVIENYERDWDSGKKFRERRTRQVDLFAGTMPEKPAGHEKIAQIHLSIIAQAVLILHATIHGQLFPATNYIYGARAVTPAATDRVRRVGLHMNWQVTTRIPEYLPANDRGMMQWLIYGTAFDCWYYDPIEKRPCYEFVHTDDLVMPYTCKSVRYDLSDVPRITRKLRKYQHEIEMLVDAGYYDSVNAAKLFGEGEDSDKLKTGEETREEPMQKAEDVIQGQDKPADDPTAPKVLLEQHFWYKLPGAPRQRPVIATVDRDTQTLLRLTIREDEDPRDRARYNREKSVNDARQAALDAQHQQALAEHAEIVATMTTPQPATDDLGGPLLDDMGNPVMLPTAPPGAIPQSPQPPPIVPAPAPVRKVPVHWFTKYGCIPNPEGIYDFGVGYLLEGDNIAADTLMSQFVSALTLSLFPTAFYSQQAKMQRGDIQLRMGEMNESPLPPDMLAKAFHQFQFPAPSPAVPKLIQQREEAGRQLVGASSILTGDSGEANETATAAQLRNNAARMNLAEMGNRFNRARENSLKNLARINAKTMDPVEYFSVTLPGQQELPPQGENVARADYLEDFQVTFHCDPRLASQPQRVQDALALLGQLLQIPPGAINPQAQQMAITMAVVGYLRALDRDDIAAVIEQAPPPPPVPTPGNPGEQHGRPGQAGGNTGGAPSGAPPGVGEPGGDATPPGEAEGGSGGGAMAA